MDYFQNREFKAFNCDEKEELIKQLRNLREYFTKHYAKSKHRYEYFEKKCESFMSSDFEFDFHIDNRKVQGKVKKNSGRPKKKFFQKSSRAKTTEILQVAKSTDFNSELLLRSALYASKKEINPGKSRAILNILKPRRLKVKKVKI